MTTMSDLVESVSADFHRCRNQRLHWLVTAILTVVFAITTVGVLGFSEAMGIETRLDDFVDLITVNAAWIFGSLFALIGLFFAVPAHEYKADRRTVTTSLPHLWGVLLSRWLQLVGATMIAFLLPFVVLAIGYDRFDILTAVVFPFLIALSLCAYLSIGMAIAVLVRSTLRLIGVLLAIYWIFAFLWETSILPLLGTILITGEAETTIGAPPFLHDLLLAVSPNGTLWALAQALLTGDLGVLEAAALLALVGWLLVVPVLAYAVASRAR